MHTWVFSAAGPCRVCTVPRSGGVDATITLALVGVPRACAATVPRECQNKIKKMQAVVGGRVAGQTHGPAPCLREASPARRAPPDVSLDRPRRRRCGRGSLTCALLPFARAASGRAGRARLSRRRQRGLCGHVEEHVEDRAELYTVRATAANSLSARPRAGTLRIYTGWPEPEPPNAPRRPVLQCPHFSPHPFRLQSMSYPGQPSPCLVRT